MTTSAEKVAARQDGDYSPRVLAPARGGQVPVWNPPDAVDNGGSDKGTPTPSAVTEGSGQ